MLDQTAILETIRLNPNDETPRLMYAGWLTDTDHRAMSEITELDQAHSEFIQLQCELAKSRGYQITDEQRAIEKRLIRTLRDSLIKQTFPELPEEVFSGNEKYSQQGWQLDRTDFEFQLGFPTKLRVTEDNFKTVLEQAHILFGENSLIEEIHVDGVSGFAAELARAFSEKPALKYRPLLRVYLDNYYRRPDLAVAGDYPSNLEANIADMQALGTSELFSQMTGLEYNNHVTEEGFSNEYINACNALNHGKNFAHIKDAAINTHFVYNFFRELADLPIAQLNSLRIFEENPKYFGPNIVNLFGEIGTNCIKKIIPTQKLHQVKTLDLSGIHVDYANTSEEESINDTLAAMIDAMPHLEHIKIFDSFFAARSPELRTRILTSIPEVDFVISESDLVLNKKPRVLQIALANGIGRAAQHVKIETPTLTPRQLQEIIALLDKKTTVQANWKRDDSALSEQLERDLERRNHQIQI